MHPSRALVSAFFDDPVLVVGTGRSGTGVVKRTLGAHPEILACDGESPMVAEVASLASPFDLAPNREYHRRALRFSVSELHERLRGLCFEAAMGRRNGMRRVFREMIRARKSPLRIKRWCAKTFPDCAQAEALKLIYPGVRFVSIVRNGCEVVQSRMRFVPMRHRTFREHCEAWSQGVERYDYVETLEDGRLIRHEDLVRDPDAVLASLWPFLGVSAHRGPATFARTTLIHPLDEPTRENIDVREALGERKPPYSGWTEEEKQTFRSVCGQAMDKLGYDVPF